MLQEGEATLARERGGFKVTNNYHQADNCSIKNIVLSRPGTSTRASKNVP